MSVPTSSSGTRGAPSPHCRSLFAGAALGLAAALLLLLLFFGLEIVRRWGQALGGRLILGATIAASCLAGRATCLFVRQFSETPHRDRQAAMFGWIAAGVVFLAGISPWAPWMAPVYEDTYRSYLLRQRVALRRIGVQTHRAHAELRFAVARLEASFLNKHREDGLSDGAGIAAANDDGLTPETVARLAANPAAGFDRALQRLDRLLVEYEQRARKTLPRSDDTRLLIADGLRFLRRDSEAIDAYYDTLRAFPEHPKALNDLGVLLYDDARYAEAEPIFRQALGVEAALFGTDHPRFARALFNLGMALRQIGRGDEAEREMRRAVAVDAAIYGPHHVAVGEDLWALADLQWERQKLDDAAALVARALEAEQTPPKRLAQYYNTRGSIRQDQGDPAGAEEDYRHAMELIAANFGPRDRAMAPKLANLASLLRDQDRLDEAQEAAREAVAIARTDLGADHAGTANAENILAAVLIAAGRLDEAEPLLRHALEVHRAALGDEHPRTASDIMNLGDWHAARGEIAAAREHYESARRTFTANYGADHPRTRRAAEKLAELPTE